MKWDLFICHASEDKERFVRPLVRELLCRNPDLHIWFFSGAPGPETGSLSTGHDQGEMVVFHNLKLSYPDPENN